MSIYFTDTNFSELQRNPFNSNKIYDSKWVMLKLLDSASFRQYTGGGRDGIFQLVITKKNIDWEYRIFDFIQYNSDCGNNIIVAVNTDDYSSAKKKYKGSSYKDNFLRFYEKSVLVHTTTKESYVKIKTRGCLKSWNSIKKDQVQGEEKPIGDLLGDPLDYRDYIMFNNGGNSSERVISSKQKGYLEMDLDKLYTAGARLYFNCGKIVQDGLLIRDGVHLKVKHRLSLGKYLIWTATSNKLGLPEETTPRKFAEKSDLMFEKLFNMSLNS